MRQDVVSISGAQCTGKTSLARDLGAALNAVVISRDPLMASLWEAGVFAQDEHRAGRIGALGYRLQGALLAEQLAIGRSVVLECVAPPAVRDRWRKLAAESDAGFWAVECVCTDIAVHRQRFDQRGQRRIGDWRLTWDHVVKTLRTYQPYPGECLTADALDPPAANVERILTAIRSGPARGA